MVNPVGPVLSRWLVLQGGWTWVSERHRNTNQNTFKSTGDMLTAHISRHWPGWIPTMGSKISLKNETIWNIHSKCPLSRKKTCKWGRRCKQRSGFLQVNCRLQRRWYTWQWEDRCRPGQMTSTLHHGCTSPGKLYFLLLRVCEGQKVSRAFVFF